MNPEIELNKHIQKFHSRQPSDKPFVCPTSLPHAGATGYDRVGNRYVLQPEGMETQIKDAKHYVEILTQWRHSDVQGLLAPQNKQELESLGVFLAQQSNQPQSN